MVGAIAGFIARLVIPGKQSKGILLTIVLGIDVAVNRRDGSRRV